MISLQQLRLALELRARARLQQVRLALERAELHERARRAVERIRAVARELQAAKKGGGMLGKAEAAKLLADARDGPGVTETERETLRWVCASFGMTRAARSYLLEQCSVPAGWVVK